MYTPLFISRTSHPGRSHGMARSRAAGTAALQRTREAPLPTASAAAVHALDELWAQVARMKEAGGGADELDRIAANLEHHLAVRRGPGTDERKEPVL